MARGRQVEVGPEHGDRLGGRDDAPRGAQRRPLPLHASAAFGRADVELQGRERDRRQQLDGEATEQPVGRREPAGEQRGDRRAVQDVAAPRPDGAGRRHEGVIAVGNEQRFDVHDSRSATRAPRLTFVAALRGIVVDDLDGLGHLVRGEARLGEGDHVVERTAERRPSLTSMIAWTR